MHDEKLANIASVVSYISVTAPLLVLWNTTSILLCPIQLTTQVQQPQSVLSPIL